MTKGQANGIPNLTVGIMTAGSRTIFAYALAGALKKLGINPVMFIDRDHKGAWWNARRFWDSLETEYGLLLQEDIHLTPAFYENIKGLVEGGEISHACGIFNYLSYRGKPVSKFRYYEWQNILGVGILMTKTFARLMLDWERYWFREDNTSDDGRVLACLAYHGLKGFHTLPSLVEHMELPSLECPSSAPFGRRRVAVHLAEGKLDMRRTPENTLKGPNIGKKDVDYFIKPELFEEYWKIVKERRA